MRSVNDIRVSVIVPVYNVEKYLARCIQSILAQKHAALEIILVDDGSPDSSGKIIDTFAEQDSRIIPVHKPNGGVSSARNAGLDAASGEYVLFVDADDHIEPEYTDYFLQLLLTGGGGYDVAVDTHHFSLRKKVQVLHDNIHVETAEQVIEKIYTGAVNVAVWNKIYRRSFLEREHIRFRNDIWFGEGMLFNIQCLQKIDSVVVGERRVYHQTYNPNSAMRHFRMDSQYCGLRSLEIQKSIWQKFTPGIEGAYSWHVRNYNWQILCGLIGNDLISQYPDDYKRSIKNLKKDILIPLKADIGIIRKIRSLIVSAVPVLSAKIYLFLRKTYVALHRKQTE